jgi:hypothetical protein
MKLFPVLRLISVSLALAGLFTATMGKANGPLYIGSPVDLPGLPFIWANLTDNTLSYWTDPGSLGSLQKSDADALVKSAFAAWAGVSTETLQFSNEGNLGADVSASNIVSVLNAAADCDTLPSSPTGGIAKQVTIIYDTDGSALSALGDDPSSILGFADAFCFDHDTTANYFQRGYALLNGKFSDGDALQVAMTHEFGHMIGLDHSQINLDCLDDTDSCEADGSIAGVPLMFPVLLDTSRTPLLADDDIAGISNLYPSSAYPSTTGEIKGHVYFSDGVTPAQGFNVIARNVTNGRVVAVSNVSGSLFTACVGVPTSVLSASYQDCDPNNPASGYGSWDHSLIGVYDIKGLTPGTYTVEVEGINNSGDYAFTGGSGLNPFGFLYGFQFPLPRDPGAAAPCSPEYLSTSTAVCSSGSATQITVGGGEVATTGTDIILRNTPPRYDAWEDEP